SIQNFFIPARRDRTSTRRRTTPAKKPRQRNNRLSGCRLSVECLEDRLALSAYITIDDATVIEGNSGTHNAAVTVRLSEPAPKQGVAVSYNTADGSAQAGSDYTAVSGKLT